MANCLYRATHDADPLGCRDQSEIAEIYEDELHLLDELSGILTATGLETDQGVFCVMTDRRIV